jgi:hypothetical protein
MLKMITFVCLVFQLPVSWQETRRDSGRLPGLIPNTSVEEVTAAWKGAHGEELYAFYWKPFAPRPGGPLVATRSWKHKVAGQEVTVSETSQFLGSQQKVLVTHLEVPGAQVMIYGRNVGENFFNALLDSIELKN